MRHEGRAGAAQGLRWDTGVTCQSHLSHAEGRTGSWQLTGTASPAPQPLLHVGRAQPERGGTGRFEAELEMTPVPSSARAEINMKMLFKQCCLFLVISRASQAFYTKPQLNLVLL